MDLIDLYRSMYRSRTFEDAVKDLWEAGLITGEMHTGHGEEGINAGVIHHLQEKDALALDYRGTPALLMRGVSPEVLLREFLGLENGLCRGAGGHMHLFSEERLIASSGIVGASGPAGLGFALAAQHLRPATVAVATFGEGAANQGMLMEAMNLAAAWSLPVVFVCKDDSVAVTTDSKSLTAGSLPTRAEAFGLHVREVDGGDVTSVHSAAGELIAGARGGGGPGWLHARCHHPLGHMLGDPLHRAQASPLRFGLPRLAPALAGAVKPGGAPLRERIMALKDLITHTRPGPERGDPCTDPLHKARAQLQKAGAPVAAVDREVGVEIATMMARVLEEIGPGGMEYA
jgi:pyruvate dehydrogenase E1 component alpha subunit